MSRIVFAHSLRKTVVLSGSKPRPIYARPRLWILLGLLNCTLIGAAMSWKPDSVWRILPAAKAYSIPSAAAGQAPVARLAESTLPSVTPSEPMVAIAAPPAPRIEPLDPKAQKAAQYIARNYHIAKEAAELIVRESFKAGKENSVDPLLMLAVIGVESRFNPLSESQAGALGLTQTMPESHPEKIATLQKDQGHILNIADNIQLGTKIVGEYMRKFDNNPILALQQYNGSLQDHSRTYSKMVLELRAKLAHAVI